MTDESVKVTPPRDPAVAGDEAAQNRTSQPHPHPKEIGGPEGLEPTRYGDWEKKGRCIDF
jgi:hypothetical protein